MPPAVAIVDTPLSVDAALAAVATRGQAASSSSSARFATTTGRGAEQEVSSWITPRTRARGELERVVAAVADLHPGVRLAAHHRIGPLADRGPGRRRGCRRCPPR